MNNVVQAEALSVSLVAEMGNAVVSTSVNPHNVLYMQETLCLHSFTIMTINGHSIKAINPETLKVGELTTLEMA